jgi:ubiquinone/menaquinone biosynthesis C-methylase UbiE
MNSAFDAVAEVYDATFSQTKIGIAQRKVIRNYLDKKLPAGKSLKILELNCGTGEDAVWLAIKGHSVLATDLSERMLEVTEGKVRQNNLTEKIKTQLLDLRKFDQYDINETFDLIFSNFGGVNCLTLNELKSLSGPFRRLLKPSGKLIMVIMPRFCLWETIYFCSKFRFKEAFRRSREKGLIAKLNGEEITTYYYSPATIKKIFSRDFSISAQLPVGFFLPPSYLEKSLLTIQSILSVLKRLENFYSGLKFLSSVSDHYLIELRLKR